MTTSQDPPLYFPKTKINEINSFNASTVIRLNQQHKLNSTTTHFIITIPNHGWSIYNANDHSILSSQKLPPNIIFKSNCFSFSIPNQIFHPSNQNLKSRSRFIYAPIASCPSDPSKHVNQAKTIWLWIENEINGFGERSHPINTTSNSTGANLIKTYSDPIQFVNPIHPNPQSNSQLARILILLQSGLLHLSDQHLNTLKTCSIYSIQHPPSIPPNLHETLHHSIQLIQSSSFHSIHPFIQSVSSPQDQLIYLTRFKPQLGSNTLTCIQSPNNPRSSIKRKSSHNQLSIPSPQLSHYSHLEIYILKISAPDQLEQLAQLSEIRDFLDLTISPQGWITILEPGHVLSTYRLSAPSNTTQSASIQQSTLIPHLPCGPIKLATYHRSKSNFTNPLIPSIVTLPSPLPLVFLFTSHPNQSNKCLGLVLDLYHQAVLHVLEFPWPTPLRTLQSVSLDQAPQNMSTHLSPSSQSDYLLMCLSYKSHHVLQVLHPPQVLLHQPPTWVEILNPLVKQATLDWIISKPDSQVQSSKNKTNLLSESIASSNLLIFSSFANNQKEKATSLEDENKSQLLVLENLKLFIERFNTIYISGPQSSADQSWDDTASKAAELAWSECVIIPLTNSLADICLASKNKKSKQFGPQDGDVEDVANPVEEKQNTELESAPRPNSLESRLNVTLASVLPKAFVATLLSMCLASFAQPKRSSEQDGAIGNLMEPDEYVNGHGTKHGNKANFQERYPAEIVKSLLKTGLVDDKMVRGSVLRALRSTQDVSVVRLGIGKMIDIRESELIETIRWVIHSQPEGASGNSATDQPTFNYQLQYFLAKIIAQALDPIPLRKAIKKLLTAHDTISVLKILLVWIEWWFDLGESSLGTTTIQKSNPTRNGNRTGMVGNCLKMNEIPNLGKIYEFLEIILDSKLIELIKFNSNNYHHQDDDDDVKLGSEVFQVLKSIQVRMNRKIEEDLILETVYGSLTQFTRAHKLSSSRSKQQENRKGNIKKKDFKFSKNKNKSWSNDVNKFKNDLTNYSNNQTKPKHQRNDQINSSLINNKPMMIISGNDEIKKNNLNHKFKSTVKISNSASNNLQHFTDYSVEKFSL